MSKDKDLMEGFIAFMEQQAIKVMDGVEPPVFTSTPDLKVYIQDKIKIMQTTEDHNAHLKASCSIDWALDINHDLHPKFTFDENNIDKFWEEIDAWLDEDYYKWVQEYRNHKEPEGGWAVCDYDRAEMYSSIREGMREAHPEFWARYTNMDNLLDEQIKLLEYSINTANQEELTDLYDSQVKICIADMVFVVPFDAVAYNEVLTALKHIKNQTNRK